MEKHIFELARGLLARGVDVEIITEDRSFLPDPENPLAGHILGIDPEDLEATGWVEQYREKSRLFADLIDPNQYDLVHAHSHYGFHTVLKLARMKQRPAMVTTYHLTPLGQLERFAQLGLPLPEGEPIDRAVAVMEEAMAQLSDTCIAVSQGVAAEVHELYGVPSHRIRLIYNWYDPTVFFPRDRQRARRLLGLDPDRQYVLYVGHFQLFRGKLLAEAMHYLPPNVTLLAIGHEPDEDVAAQLGDRIVSTGYVPPAGMALYYSAADLQAFPPVYGAFGLVLVEGMACGCPAVAFDYPAMNEIITPRSGYLVQEPTAGAYAAGILHGLEDGGKKREAAAARARDFDMESQIDKVLELYQELTSRVRVPSLASRPA